MIVHSSTAELLKKCPSAGQWKSIGLSHHHGIALPLFSLHSHQSSGIGEYLDLLPLLSFVKEIGYDTIQLLPLNDTVREQSPYSAVSAFALNPLFLSLWALPEVERVSDYKEKLHLLHQLTKSKHVDYQTLYPLKMDFLKEYVNSVQADLHTSEKYHHFIKENPWLDGYALYRSLKAFYDYTSWEKWPINLKSPSQKLFDTLLVDWKHDCDFYRALQFFCFEQLKEVKEEAEKEKILLKGDLPILTSRDSADVWSTRYFFLLNLSAGAPPDHYSKEGQNWGFPLYDWTEMQKEKYSFWKERLRVASNFYHLFRIDHVVGLFRLWGIPMNRKATEGSFFPENESEWIPLGKKILELMLKESPMLPIAEDLGVVPPHVRHCLTEHGIPGTKVMRWERRWEQDGSFISPLDYNPISMTTVSTHDSDTLGLWWRHSPKESKELCHEKGWQWHPFLSGDQLAEILKESHHSSSLFHINLLQEYLALFPDLISPHLSDERINIPGKVLSTNWTYRFRPSVEMLLDNEPLKRLMGRLIRE